jgi:hypothetical protein
MRSTVVLRSTTIGRAPSICPDFLKEKLYRYLADTRVAGSRHLAKITGNEIADRVQKLRVIEHVEELSSQLEQSVFRDLCGLLYSHIRISAQKPATDLSPRTMPIEQTITKTKTVI